MQLEFCYLSLLVFILESFKTALCCLVVCWLSSGIPVVYSDLSSSYSDELRSGCSIEIDIIVLVFVKLSALHTEQEVVKAALVSLVMRPQDSSACN